MSDYRIFDRTLLRQRLRRALPGRQKFSFLQDLSADRLRDRLLDVKHSFPNVLESGTVLDVPTIQKKQISYHVRDQILETANSDIVFDEELLPFGADRFDLIVSNLSLQFANDLPGALLQMKRSLRKNGLFLAALAGGQTLLELRDVLMEAELELSGGISPRIAPMVDLRDAAGLLQRAGFALPVADSEVVTVSYKNLFHLMQDLRGMGWSNNLYERSKKFTPRALFLKTAQIYQAKYPDRLDKNKIQASFELIYLSGWREN